jgi:hypothetical protein
VFYAPKAQNVDNLCQWCDPATPTAWTNVPASPKDSTGCTVACFYDSNFTSPCSECTNCTSYYGVPDGPLRAGQCDGGGACSYGPIGFATRR